MGTINPDSETELAAFRNRGRWLAGWCALLVLVLVLGAGSLGGCALDRRPQPIDGDGDALPALSIMPADDATPLTRPIDGAGDGFGAIDAGAVPGAPAPSPPTADDLGAPTTDDGDTDMDLGMAPEPPAMADDDTDPATDHGDPNSPDDRDDADPAGADPTGADDQMDADRGVDAEPVDDDPPVPDRDDDPVRDGCRATETVMVPRTIVVSPGQRFDGRCRRYVAGGQLGANPPGADGVPPMFELRDGAELINVVLGWPLADGVHTYGDAELRNVHWERIQDDALTIKQPGHVRIDGGSARDADDAVFQINAPSTFELRGFNARRMGKLIRQDGGTTFPVEIDIDRCDISQVSEAIVRTDSWQTTVSMTNTRYSGVQGTMWMGVSPQNLTLDANTPF